MSRPCGSEMTTSAAGTGESRKKKNPPLFNASPTRRRNVIVHDERALFGAADAHLVDPSSLMRCIIIGTRSRKRRPDVQSNRNERVTFDTAHASSACRSAMSHTLTSLLDPVRESIRRKSGFERSLIDVSPPCLCGLGLPRDSRLGEPPLSQQRRNRNSTRKLITELVTELIITELVIIIACCCLGLGLRGRGQARAQAGDQEATAPSVALLQPDL